MKLNFKPSKSAFNFKLQQEIFIRITQEESLARLF